MSHTITEVVLGWLFVLTIDLGVVFLFYKTAQNSVSKGKTLTLED
jgi:hypothetical protein